jgi:hypothetical protein
MHFLSHYYVDRGKNNPFFVAGALLPDIAPGFTKTYNSRIRNKDLYLTDDVVYIHEGVLRHYELDAVFHASVAFRESCHKASQRMADEGLDRDKYRFWFLSHIATEVMLDRQLILSDTGLVDEYYGMLNSVDINILERYLNFVVDVEGKSKILINFIRFLEIRFLKHVGTIEGASEGIVRTVLKATGISFDDADRAKLEAALRNIEDDIRYTSEKLLPV